MLTMQKNFFLLNIFLIFINSFSFTLMQLNNIIPKSIKKKDIYNELSIMIQNKKYDTYILNDPIFNIMSIKKDITKIIFENNLINFKELTFDEYICKNPSLFVQNTAFYINDYLVKDGRILNDEEKLIISKKNSNYIFLDVHDIDSVPIKDNHFNKKFSMLNFPIILKNDIINYIYELVDYHNYNEYLYLVNWNIFDLDKLNFTDIHVLLEKIDNYFFKTNNIKKIKNTKDVININEKNLNNYIMTIINILRKVE